LESPFAFASVAFQLPYWLPDFLEPSFRDGRLVPRPDA